MYIIYDAKNMLCGVSQSLGKAQSVSSAISIEEWGGGCQLMRVYIKTCKVHRHYGKRIPSDYRSSDVRKPCRYAWSIVNKE